MDDLKKGIVKKEKDADKKPEEKKKDDVYSLNKSKKTLKG